MPHGHAVLDKYVYCVFRTFKYQLRIWILASINLRPSQKHENRQQQLRQYFCHHPSVPLNSSYPDIAFNREDMARHCGQTQCCSDKPFVLSLSKRERRRKRPFDRLRANGFGKTEQHWGQTTISQRDLSDPDTRPRVR